MERLEADMSFEQKHPGAEEALPEQWVASAYLEELEVLADNTRLAVPLQAAQNQRAQKFPVQKFPVQKSFAQDLKNCLQLQEQEKNWHRRLKAAEKMNLVTAYKLP